MRRKKDKKNLLSRNIFVQEKTYFKKIPHMPPVLTISLTITALNRPSFKTRFSLAESCPAYF